MTTTFTFEVLSGVDSFLKQAQLQSKSVNNNVFIEWTK